MKDWEDVGLRREAEYKLPIPNSPTSFILKMEINKDKLIEQGKELLEAAAMKYAIERDEEIYAILTEEKGA